MSDLTRIRKRCDEQSVLSGHEAEFTGSQSILLIFLQMAGRPRRSTVKVRAIWDNLNCLLLTASTISQKIIHELDAGLDGRIPHAELIPLFGTRALPFGGALEKECCYTAIGRAMRGRTEKKEAARQKARASLNDRLGSTLISGKSGRRSLTVKRSLAGLLVLIVLGLPLIVGLIR